MYNTIASLPASSYILLSTPRLRKDTKERIMPTYVYRCKSCSHEFEEFQKISDEPLVQCPSCDKKTLIRMIGGGAGLHFKGSGFYLTDYKKKGGDGKPKEEKKSETPPESKPDTKPGDSGSTKVAGDS